MNDEDLEAKYVNRSSGKAKGLKKKNCQNHRI